MVGMTVAVAGIVIVIVAIDVVVIESMTMEVVVTLTTSVTVAVFVVVRVFVVVAVAVAVTVNVLVAVLVTVLAMALSADISALHEGFSYLVAGVTVALKYDEQSAGRFSLETRTREQLQIFSTHCFPSEGDHQTYREGSCSHCMP